MAWIGGPSSEAPEVFRIAVHVPKLRVRIDNPKQAYQAAVDAGAEALKRRINDGQAADGAALPIPKDAGKPAAHGYGETVRPLVRTGQLLASIRGNASDKGGTIAPRGSRANEKSARVYKTGKRAGQHAAKRNAEVAAILAHRHPGIFKPDDRLRTAIVGAFDREAFWVLVSKEEIEAAKALGDFLGALR